jgi:hypothetical protein
MGREMKATVIILGLLAVGLFAHFGDPVAIVPGANAKALEPVWMMVSGASLIALGSVVRRHMS